MKALEYEAPDGSLIKNPSAETLRGIVETAQPEYWQQGGNGEAVLRVVDGGDMLLVKQPPETGEFLCTFLSETDILIPYSGGSFDAFAWEERGGDPFKVPMVCLVARETAAQIVEYFVRHQAAFPELTWIAWDELPDQYQIE